MLKPAWSVELAELDFVGEPDRRVRDAEAQLVDEVARRASIAAIAEPRLTAL